MIAIFGSGFGLYGYLPALIRACNEDIVLPGRYRQRYQQRPELQQFASRIHWAADDVAALSLASGVVLAQRPGDNIDRLTATLERASIHQIVIEKPVAITPAQAEQVVDRLQRSRKKFGIGYTFRFTHWASCLQVNAKQLRPNHTLHLRWNFMAHHFQNELRNWKRSHTSGGGVVRFYGIHLIALLAEIGYSKVLRSQTFGATFDEPSQWTALFSGKGLNPLQVEVDSRHSESAFGICWHRESDPVQQIQRKVSVEPVVSMTHPFAHAQQNADRQPELDPRFDVLTAFCQSVWAGDTQSNGWLQATNALWEQVEAIDEKITEVLA